MTTSRGPNPYPPLQVMEYHERTYLRTARNKVIRLYPPPVAAVLMAELDAWEEFGYRFGGKSRIMALARFIVDSEPAPLTT